MAAATCQTDLAGFDTAPYIDDCGNKASYYTADRRFTINKAKVVREGASGCGAGYTRFYCEEGLNGCGATYGHGSSDGFDYCQNNFACPCGACCYCSCCIPDNKKAYVIGTSTRGWGANYQCPKDYKLVSTASECKIAASVIGIGYKGEGAAHFPVGCHSGKWGTLFSTSFRQGFTNAEHKPVCKAR